MTLGKEDNVERLDRQTCVECLAQNPARIHAVEQAMTDACSDPTLEALLSLL